MSEIEDEVCVCVQSVLSCMLKEKIWLWLSVLIALGRRIPTKPLEATRLPHLLAANQCEIHYGPSRIQFVFFHGLQAFLWATCLF